MASGKYAYHPLAGFEKDNRTDTILVFSNEIQLREGGGGGSGTLQEFLRSFENIYKVHLIDETQPSDIRLSYRWQQYRSLSDQDNIDDYLKTIAQQTSIQFQKEIRKVPIWVISKSEE